MNAASIKRLAFSKRYGYSIPPFKGPTMKVLPDRKTGSIPSEQAESAGETTCTPRSATSRRMIFL